MALANWGNTLIGQDDYINNAVNRARNQFDAGLNSSIRQAGRMGINPNSGAFMNMLNNAQYDRTAGINAAANDASYNWLQTAQDQFNKDRAAGMEQERINNQNNQWWADFGAARKREKADYAFQEKLYENNKLPWQTQQNQQNQQTAPVTWTKNFLGLGSTRDKYILNPRRPFDWTGYKPMWRK
ncbi:MAG: hypothetical protein J5858_15245 [Lentisphaeria bacterium]|nr:hypothetical protein [Lentisphaeria bacterium]